MKDRFFKYIDELQKNITDVCEKLDGKSKFEIDKWARTDKRGDGVTSIITDGNVFEKGGVNISGVHGKLPKIMQSSLMSMVLIFLLVD